MINKKARSRAIMMVFATVVIDMLGGMLTMPIMANFVREVMGEPDSCFDPATGARLGAGASAACDSARADLSGNVGLPSTLYAVASLLSALWLPRVSDNMGRKAAFIISLCGSVGGFLLLGLTQSFTMLLVVRFATGLFGGSSTVANAYITDVYEKAERGPMFARLGATSLAAAMFGPLLGSTLAELLGLRGPFFVSAALSGLALLGALAYLKNPSDLHIPGTDGSGGGGSGGGDAEAETESVQLVIRGGAGVQDAGAPPEEGVAAKKEGVASSYNAWRVPLNLAIGCQTFLTTASFNGFNTMLALWLLEPRFGIVNPTDSIEKQGQAAAASQGLAILLVVCVALPTLVLLYPVLTKRFGALVTGTIGSAIFGASHFLIKVRAVLFGCVRARLLLTARRSPLSSPSRSTRAPRRSSSLR